MFHLYSTGVKTNTNNDKTNNQSNRLLNRMLQNLLRYHFSGVAAKCPIKDLRW